MMAIGSRDRVSGYLSVLFGAGAAGDLADGELLDRFVTTRDPAAFEVLVARHGPMVLRVCRSALTDPEAAQDAFQAVFLVLVRRAPAIRARESLASWLYGVAARVSARARVDAARRRRHERAASILRPEAASFDDGTDALAALQQAIASLPPRYREAIVCCYFEGQTCDAVARRLGCPVGTIKARLCRARGMIKKRLIRRGFALPAAGVLAESLTDARWPTSPVPIDLAQQVVATAVGRWTAGAAASSGAAILANGVLQTMLVRRLVLPAVLFLPLAVASGTALRALGSYPLAVIAMTPDDPKANAPAKPQSGPATQPAARREPITDDDPTSRALRETLPAAAAKPADPYYFTFTLIRLAKARAALGDQAGSCAAFDLAAQVAVTVPNEHLRRLAIMRTGVVRGRLGDHESARAAIEPFAREAERLGPEARYNLMSMVIEFLYQAGLRDESKTLLDVELRQVDAIANEQSRDGGIYRLIHIQVEMGDYEAALRQAARYTGKRSNYLQPLIDIIVRWNSSDGGPAAPRAIVDRALELADAITYPYPRAMAMANVAPALARAGDVEAALRLARDIDKHCPPDLPRDFFRAEILGPLAEIARIQAKTGDAEGARKTLREAIALGGTVNTASGGVIFDRMRRVAEAAAEIGDVEAAQNAAAMTDQDRVEKALALVAVARAQLKAGDRAAWRQTLTDALTQTRGIRRRDLVINDNPTDNANQALHAIALVYAEAGDAKAAIATVAMSGSEGWKSQVLAAIAPIQARQGDIAGALATARSIKAPGHAGDAYCEIAAIQTRAHGAEAALTWANPLQPPTMKACALVGIADGLAARKAQKPGGEAAKR